MFKAGTGNLKMIVITFVIALGFSISLQSLLAAWSDPASFPPNGNSSAPLNVSSTNQSKNAGLIINAGSISANGLIVQGGNVGIGTINPATYNGDVEKNVSIVSATASKNTNLNLTYSGGTDSQYSIIEAVNSSNPQSDKRVAQISMGNPNAAEQDRGAILYYIWYDGSYKEAMRMAGDGNIGVGVANPSTALEIGQNRALKIGNAYLSSGGNYTHLANNEWFNGSAWQTNGANGALIQIAGQAVNIYNHNGAGGHTTEAVINPSGLTVYGNITASGDVCNGSGKCLNTAGVGTVSSPPYWCSLAWNEGATTITHSIGNHKFCAIGVMLHDGTQGGSCSVTKGGGTDWYLSCNKWMGGGVGCSANCID